MKANIRLWSIAMMIVGAFSQTPASIPEGVEVPHSLQNAPWMTPIAPITPITPYQNIPPKLQHNKTIDLWRDVQVLCMVMTSTPFHRLRAEHIRNTWGSRCNNLIFISNGTDPFLPAINMFPKEDGKPDAPNLKEAFKYVYDNLFDTFDWIVKAEDKSYMVVENLRHFLSSYDPTEKLYMGYVVKSSNSPAYMHGGPGYVLSKEGLRVLVEEGFTEECVDPQRYSEFSDKDIGACLYSLGVRMEDTRDSLGRHRFLPYSPGLFLKPDTLPPDDPVWEESFYPFRTGIDCCSESWISARVNLPQLMYLYEFMAHNVRVASPSSPKPIPSPARKASTEEKPLYVEVNVTMSSDMRVNQGRRGRNQTVELFKDTLANSDVISNIIKEAIEEVKTPFFFFLEPEPELMTGEFRVDQSGLNQFKKKIRLLCMVMTFEENQMERALHIRETWGKRCTHLIFMGDADDNVLNVVNMSQPGLRGEHVAWQRTKRSFTYIYKKYKNKYDWVLKIQDQSYVIVENLLALLMKYNPAEKLQLGCRFKSPHIKNGFMSMDSGSVFSKAAVKAFVDQTKQNQTCREDMDIVEDVLMSMCLQDRGVQLVDTRDNFGRFRFLPLSVEYYLMPGLMTFTTFNWWFESSFYPQKIGLDCCSDYIVALNHIATVNMYLYDFFLYQFKLMTNMNREDNEFH